MKSVNHFVITGIILVLILISTCVFTVVQGSEALVTRFGVFVPHGNQGETYGPGLHFKFPFVDKVLRFDTRLQSYNETTSRIMTKEKKDVLVDYYVKWRIFDLAQYYRATGGNPQKVQLLVNQQIDDNLRALFGQRTIPEVISDDRAVVMQILSQTTSTDVAKLGIQVVDVRIKTIDLPKETSQAIFANMRAEREEAAKAHRAQGASDAQAIRARAQAEGTVIVATANEMADKMRGSGDAKAAQLYANAYSRDPEFYSFYQSLEAYRQIFAKGSNVLVISPESQFFHYFNSSRSSEGSLKP